VVSGRRNDHFAGYTVTIHDALEPSQLRDRLRPGPFELIHCSSPETAQRIADWLNALTEEPA
jgi:hypothetical protein